MAVELPLRGPRFLVRVCEFYRSAREDDGMRNRIHLLIATALVLNTLVSVVAQETNEARSIALNLQPVQSEVSAGQAPQFRLTLSNTTDRVERVLNIAKRVDLQHTYYNVIIVQNRKAIWVPRAISDPGPVSKTDWLEIAPGATRTFLLKSFPDAFDQLPPGSYEAYVEFWQDPYESHKTRYKSNSATFTIKK